MSDDDDLPLPVLKAPAPRRKAKMEWSKFPGLDGLVLDWLDEHPQERRALLLEPPGRGSSRVARITGNFKITSCMSIVTDVLSKETHPTIRDMVQNEPERLAESVKGRVSYLQGLYKNFIDVAGPEIANKTPEEIEQMSFDQWSGVGLEMRAFPLWRRLHGYFRTLSHLNRFYFPIETESKVTLSQAAGSSKKRKLGQNKAPPTCDILELSSDEELESKEPFSLSGNSLRVSQVSSSQGDEKPRKRNRIKYEEDCASSPETDRTREDLSVSREGRTLKRNHDIEMARLRLKRKELDSADREKAREAELRRLEIEERMQAELIKERHRVAEASRVREQEKHELIAKLMTLISKIDDNEATKLPELGDL